MFLKSLTKKSFCIIVIINIFLFSCSTSVEKLQSTNPEFYYDIIGKWYILSNEKSGEIFAALSFNNDGTITGDVQSFFGYTKASWNVLRKEGGYNARGYVNIVLSNDAKDIQNTSIFYTKDKNRELTGLNPDYLIFIPPFTICQYSVFSAQSAKSVKSYVFSKDLTAINNFKNVKNDKEKWSQVNKDSVKGHLDFLRNAQSQEFKSEAEKSFHTLLDKKVIKYLNKYHKEYAGYSNFEIQGVSSNAFDGSKDECKFFEMVKINVLGVDPFGRKVGFKLRKSIYYDGAFELVTADDKVIITLKPSPAKNKLVVVDLISNYQKAPPQFFGVALQSIVAVVNQYPPNERIDVDLLEEL